MSHLATKQLSSIHSMLSAGHRNLRIERHSLMLWGISCGGLILASEHILTSEQFPVIEQRAIAWLIMLAFSLSCVSLLDWHLTRRAKHARDEAWSFIHRQVLKVWWLLMSVGVLLTFATFFYGGGYMIYAAWVVLIGLSLYVHGLFSEELLEWTGAFIIAIGIAMLAFRLDIKATQYVAASTLGLGLPLLSIMLDRGRQRAFSLRLLQSVGWLLFVLIPPLLAQRFITPHISPDMPTVTVAKFLENPLAAQIVSLPAGSTIPVKVEISGDVFQPNKEAVLPLVLNTPIEIVMEHGQPTGAWRLPGDDWTEAHKTHWASIPWVKAAIPPSGPEIQTSLIVEIHPQPHQ